MAAIERMLNIPGDRHMAFAVCIVHSKPEGLTIKEYIRLLRQHVGKGRRENALSSVYRHLDKSSYWRSEYERMKDALAAAEDETTDLNLQVHRLKAAAETARTANPAKKRKKQDDDETIPVPRSPKKAKSDAPVKTAPLTPFNVDAGFSFSHLGEHGDTLMRSFYQAHALLKSHDKTEPALLAHHLVQAANAVSQILSQAARQYESEDQSDRDTLKAILTAVTRAMQSLIVGYGRVSNVADGAEVRGRVIYAYVQIFEKSITIISELAESEAERIGTGAPIAPLGPSTSKGKAKQVQEITAKTKQSAAIDLMSSFVIRGLDLLDAKTESHKALFEGLSYVLIERLAVCLYTLTFGRSRGATLEDEIAAGAQPDEIEDASQGPSPKHEEKEVQAAKVEAPYLIRVLTRLMQAAPAHFGTSRTTKSGKSKAASKTNVTKDNLAITAKERLQRTLLNCMFGTEGMDEQDPFIDCLQKPALSGPLPAVPSVKESDVQDWFKEEVWRLLGWDILSREGDW